MADTIIITKAIADMHASFNSSLDKVYAEIKGCNKRVTELETALEIRKALCKEKKERETGQRKLWQPVVRGTALAGTIALFAIAWDYIKILWEKIKVILDMVQ